MNRVSQLVSQSAWTIMIDGQEKITM